MADRKDTKREWTDTQKETLIYEVSRVPKGQSIQPVLDKYGVSSSAFYSMRRRMKMKKGNADIVHEAVAAMRDKGKAAAQAAVAQATAPAAPLVKEDFRKATKSRKLVLLAEYKRLPKEEKKAWQEAHNASMSLITYHNLKNKSKAKSKAKITNTGKHTPEELPALVAEYYALPHVGGYKRAWLDDHGLNHQNMFDYRRRVREMGVNGSSNSMTPAVIPVVRQSRTAPHVPIAPTPTLQDGVNYLEIKRDLYNEIIADLNRVLKGGR